MNEDALSTAHIFNKIRRNIAQEFDGLNLLFFIYKDENIPAIIKEREREILDHPAGKVLLENIGNALKKHKDQNFFVGLAEHTEKRFLGLFRKTTYIGACFIHETSLTYFEDENFACKATAYRSAFYAIHSYILKKRAIRTKSKPPRHTDPTSSNNEELRIKLMADCFMAMHLEMSGYKGSIQQITKQYCTLTIAPSKAFIAEDHPLPIAIDGISVVYKDLKDQIEPDAGPLRHTYFMTEELGETYDDMSLAHWTRFCKAIMDMSWANYNNNKILSAAVYASDSPYIRSYAHILAETLNTTPTPLKDIKFYNPFSEHERNERVHTKLSNMEFLKILEEINKTGNSKIFLKEACAQTAKLLKGHPIGWCASALIEAENAYKLFTENPLAQEQIIENAFQAAFTQMRWKDIQKLNRLFITMRRNGEDITPQNALETVKSHPNYKHCINAFELLNATKQKAA